MSSETTSPAAPASSKAVGAGYGLVLITGAKIWFMVGGAVIGFVLPWLLGSKTKYGEWAFVLSAVSVLNNVMVTATIQTVAKFASRGDEWVDGVKRSALKLQVLVGGLAGLGFLLATPWIAEFEHDPALVPGLRLSAGVVVAYAFYAVFVGAANGTRQFHKQAGLDSVYTTLRALLVCGGAAVFGSVVASVAGFVAAAGAILVLSVFVVGIGPTRKTTPVVDLARFMAPVAAYLLITNLLMFVDGWVIKRLVAESVAGQAGAAAIASAKLALYTAAQQLARLPYQAIIAVTFVIFPLVSRSTFAADAARTREYVEKSIRLSLLVVLAMATTVAARPEGLLVFFPAEYLPAGPALRLLAFGYVAYSVFTIAGTILNGAGRTLLTAIIALITLGVDVAATWLGVWWALRHGRDPLVWAAAGTLGAMSLGVVLTLVVLQRRFGASLRLATLLRAGLAVAVALTAGRFLPLHGKLGNLLGCAVGGLGFVATLAASRELTLGEVRALLRRSPR